MATALGKIIADFTTSLAASVSIGGTTATLQSATDDDGVALPSGTYYFAIDGDNSQKEFIKCTLSGTSLSSIQSVSRQGALTSGFARAHRVGASVTLTDFAQLKLLTDLLNGATDLDSTDPLKYDGTATISDSNHLATKGYADGLAIAGAPDSSTTVKGIVKMSTAPASAASPIAVGDNDPRVPTTGENDALATGDTPGSSNTYVTQKMFQKNAEKYAAGSSGSDAYAVTLSPVPAAYVTGMLVLFKADVANTGAATLNVNSLGAKTIKKWNDQDLETGDIESGQVVLVAYDGTNFQMLSLTAQAPTTFVYSAGSKVLAQSASTATSTDTTNPQKLKEIQISSVGRGTVTVDFELANGTGSGGTVHAQVYINGVAQGTDRTATGTSFTNYSQTFSVAPGDLVQVYGYGTAGNVNTASVRNFKVMAGSYEVTTTIT